MSFNVSLRVGSTKDCQQTDKAGETSCSGFFGLFGLFG
jgi:hypothetical protein